MCASVLFCFWRKEYCSFSITHTNIHTYSLNLRLFVLLFSSLANHKTKCQSTSVCQSCCFLFFFFCNQCNSPRVRVHLRVWEIYVWGVHVCNIIRLLLVQKLSSVANDKTKRCFERVNIENKDKKRQPNGMKQPSNLNLNLWHLFFKIIFLCYRAIMIVRLYPNTKA